MVIQDLLKFSGSNAKLKGQGYAIFDLPAGYTCPGALDCMTKANKETGKIKDGACQKFRCFAASLEAIFANTRKSRWHNLELLRAARTVNGMFELLRESIIPARNGYRWHASGDFFSQTYFDAFLKLAADRPRKLFYAYTKSLPFWVKAGAEGRIPENVVLTASRGGNYDDLIKEHSLREVVTVYHPDQAKAMGLEIDHDDSLARNPHVNKFALLIHGTQPANSLSQDAIKVLKRENIPFSYGRGK